VKLGDSLRTAALAQLVLELADFRAQLPQARSHVRRPMPLRPEFRGPRTNP
jgi:hypothetical protein